MLLLYSMLGCLVILLVCVVCLDGMLLLFDFVFLIVKLMSFL